MNDLLIVNPFHSTFAQIPVGSFGICDYLEQRGHSASILNLALYGPDDYLKKLKFEIESRRPRCVGIILHWKELIDNALFISSFIKLNYPEVTLVAGGMTASCLAEDLLKSCDSIDYIIRGESEIALDLIISGSECTAVPGLTYREGDSVVHNAIHINDKEFLNNIVFTRVDYLIDEKLYKERYAPFMLFMGRGCIYDCSYCGGSRKSFLKHDRRSGPVYRSVESIIRDLKILLPYRDTVYICFDISKKYTAELFRAIVSDEELRGKFCCHYGSWSLMDDEVLSLYKEAFKFPGTPGSSLIEISPETSIDEDRHIVRDKGVDFSTKDLMRLLRRIDNILGKSTTVTVWYSYFHKTHTKRRLVEEMVRLHELRESIYRSNFDSRVIVFQQSLATDPGSEYWDYFIGKLKSVGPVEYLCRGMKEWKHADVHSIGMENLCFYLPDGIDSDFAMKFRVLARFMSVLYEAVPWYMFLLGKALKPKGLLKVCEDLIRKLLLSDVSKRKLMEIVELHPYWPERLLSDRADLLAEVIDLISRSIRHTHRNLYDRHRSFFDGLKKVFLLPLMSRDSVISEVACPSAQKCLMKRPMLDRKRIVITDFDYLSDDIFDQLDGGLRSLRESRTIYIKAGDSVDDLWNFNYDRYWRIIKALDGKREMLEIMQMLDDYKSITDMEREEFRDFLHSHMYYFTK